jgi:hypothetical protein
MPGRTLIRCGRPLAWSEPSIRAMTDLVGLDLALVGFALVAIVVGVFLRLWI